MPLPRKDLPRLTRRVANYLKYRPRYPEAIISLLRDGCGLTRAHRIADVGTGTGLLAELFLRNGNPVVGVEPDPDMRAGARRYLGRFPLFEVVEGAAEATTLPARSVDFVTAGQAFHWFDLEAAREEFRRILRPGGWIVVGWNIQQAGGTPFLDALQRFWETRAFWKELPDPEAQRQARAQSYRLSPVRLRRDLLEPFFGPGGFREASFLYPLVCDYERLKGRVLSNAPALDPEDSGYAEMLAALEAIFRAHQRDGVVTIEHETFVVYGRLPGG